MALALLPVVPAASVIIEEVLDVLRLPFWGFGPWKQQREYQFHFALLWTIGMLIVCRGFLTRKPGPLLITLPVCGVPFLQVFWGKAIWSNQGFLARLSDDILELGQHILLCGLFVWLLVFIWLIAEQQAMKQEDSEVGRARTMSPLAWRLVAGLGAIPFIVGVFVISSTLWGAIQRSTSTTFGYTCAGTIGIISWLAIWRHQVIWSGRVIVQTAVIAGLTLLLPILWCWYIEHVTPANRLSKVVSFAFPIMGYGWWMAWTARVWPIKGDVVGGGRSVPHCPACDCPLIGLTHTRCPECGCKPTLDVLWQRQADG